MMLLCLQSKVHDGYSLSPRAGRHVVVAHLSGGVASGRCPHPPISLAAPTCQPVVVPAGPAAWRGQEMGVATCAAGCLQAHDMAMCGVLLSLQQNRCWKPGRWVVRGKTYKSTAFEHKEYKQDEALRGLSGCCHTARQQHVDGQMRAWPPCAPRGAPSRAGAPGRAAGGPEEQQQPAQVSRARRSTTRLMSMLCPLRDISSMTRRTCSAGRRGGGRRGWGQGALVGAAGQHRTAALCGSVPTRQERDCIGRQDAVGQGVNGLHPVCLRGSLPHSPLLLKAASMFSTAPHVCAGETHNSDVVDDLLNRHALRGGLPLRRRPR